MSVRQGKSKVADLETQVKQLQEEIKEKDNLIFEQITNTQLALCELYESGVNTIV